MEQQQHDYDCDCCHKRRTDRQQRNGYRTIKQIGAGSFGTCLLCERIADGQHVVLKKMSLEDEEARNEARLLEIISKVPHQNVLTIHESYKSLRSVYIILEYMEGGDLHEHIKRNQENAFTDKQVLKYTHQIAAALEHIHQLRIVHRDVKPKNILLTKDHKHLKLCDFGIAMELPEDNLPKGKLNASGTIHYRAPEMHEAKEYDFKVDIWSLGCVVYELVEREMAFPGENILAVANKVCNDPIQFPECKLSHLMRILLTLSPINRPSAKDVIDFVRTMLASLPIDLFLANGFLYAIDKVRNNETTNGAGNSSKKRRLSFWRSNKKETRALGASG